MPTAAVLTIITNPRAGHGRNAGALADIRRRLEASPAEVEYVVSTSAEHAEEAAKYAARTGRTIVACGGDGHVGRLAGVAARCSVPFGIIPTGAGNDFANEVGLSLARLDAVAEILTGTSTRRVDMGRVGDHLFCGVAGCGFSSEANEWANHQRWIGGTALYVAAVLKTLATYRPRPIILSVDGETIATAAWLIGIANARALGGGMLIAPDATITDGLLDIVIVGPVSRLEFLRTFPKVFKGTHVDLPEIMILRGGRVDIEQPDGAVPLAIYADGERAGELPSRFEAVSRCLELLIHPDEKAPT